MGTDNTMSLISRIRANSYRYIVYQLKSRGHEGLAPSHGDILSLLIFYGEMTKKEIADRIHRDKSTVTTLIKKLEKLGYIDTKENAMDRRSSLVFLTQKGIDMKSDFLEISEQLFEIQYRGMDDELIAQVKKGLRMIDENFKNP